MAGLQTANPYLDESGMPKGGTATPWVGTQAQVDDSVANNVAALTSKDSKMNQMARTEGLKLANSRGLLNSTMAIGAAEDAVIRNALPIAAQDASQAFQKNTAARNFEYGMEDKNRANAFQSGERLGGQEFLTGENVAARTWQTVENNAQRGWQGDENQMNRDLEELLQNNQITSAEKMGFAQIASAEGIEAAGRALQEKLQANSLASTERMQKLEITSNEHIAKLSTDLQNRIAGMNVKSTDKAAATQAVVNFSAQYNARVADINSNTSMSAGARSTALTAAKNWLNTTLNLTEQLYGVDLRWAT